MPIKYASKSPKQAIQKSQKYVLKNTIKWIIYKTSRGFYKLEDKKNQRKASKMLK